MDTPLPHPTRRRGRGRAGPFAPSRPRSAASGLTGSPSGVRPAQGITRFDTLAALAKQEGLVGTEPAQRRHQFLVVDLEPYTYPSAVSELKEWREKLRWMHLVLFSPKSLSARVMQVIDQVKEAYPDAALLHEADVGSLAAWQRIFSKTVVDRFAAEILSDLTAQAILQGQPLDHVELLGKFLAVAPHCLTVQQVCTYLNRNRITMWAELKNGQTATGKELLSAMRLLYVFKLRELGWSHRAIGIYMHCCDGKHICRRLTRQMAVGVTDLKDLTYTDALKMVSCVLAWAKCTGRQCPLGTREHCPLSLRTAAKRFLLSVRSAVASLILTIALFEPQLRAALGAEMACCEVMRGRRRPRYEMIHTHPTERWLPPPVYV